MTDFETFLSVCWNINLWPKCTFMQIFIDDQHVTCIENSKLSVGKDRPLSCQILGKLTNLTSVNIILSMMYSSLALINTPDQFSMINFFCYNAGKWNIVNCVLIIWSGIWSQFVPLFSCSIPKPPEEWYRSFWVIQNSILHILKL